MWQEYLILVVLLLALYASSTRYVLSKKNGKQTPPLLVPALVLFCLAIVYQLVMIVIHIIE
jgi:hypothetical protein